jgi:hypothetical protein
MFSRRELPLKREIHIFLTHRAKFGVVVNAIPDVALNLAVMLPKGNHLVATDNTVEDVFHRLIHRRNSCQRLNNLAPHW